MTPQALAETCLKPENRHLIQLKPENIEEDMKVFDMLMGKNAEGRKHFIMTHKISGEIGDTYEDTDEEE